MDSGTKILKRNKLADEILKGLSGEEQIKWLTEKLAKPWEDGEDELDLLEGLDTVSEDKVAFREQLRHICRRLIITATEFPKSTTTRFPKLATAIAKKILEGWDWEWGEYGDCKTPEYHRRAKKVFQMNLDAKDCFQFFCQTYELGNKQLKKLLIEVLHEHINARGAWLGRDIIKWTWGAEDLNKWILAEGIPSDIKVVLAGARLRIGGSVLVQQEVSLSQSFQTQTRSPEAISLISAQMETVRRTEELAQTLVEKMRPSNQFGDRNPETIFISYVEVEWKLESASVACVKIIFRHIVNPRTIANIQTLRDQFLSKIENPPRILIETEGSDGSHYKEE